MKTTSISQLNKPGREFYIIMRSVSAQQCDWQQELRSKSAQSWQLISTFMDSLFKRETIKPPLQSSSLMITYNETQQRRLHYLLPRRFAVWILMWKTHWIAQIRRLTEQTSFLISMVRFCTSKFWLYLMSKEISHNSIMACVVTRHLLLS